MNVEPQQHGPVTRLMIARYLVCSDDPNPVHVDEPFARSLGFPSVIAQGMLSAGWIAEALVRVVGQDRVRSFAVRFSAPVYPGEMVSVGANSLRRWSEGDISFEELDIYAEVEGSRRVNGTAVVDTGAATRRSLDADLAPSAHETEDS